MQRSTEENCQATTQTNTNMIVTKHVDARKAKPFLKWAGGKTQLLPEIEKRLPSELKTAQINTYVEPFVGGGAVFFYIAEHFSCFSDFHVFDINRDVIEAYRQIKNNFQSVVNYLKRLERDFLQLSQSNRKMYYLKVREDFNIKKKKRYTSQVAAYLIFLNRTCYNGLYRLNKKSEYNVPFGYYKKPTICDAENLYLVSCLLQKAETGYNDFETSESYINNNTFVYLDPPYRPISCTADFTSYSKNSFTQKDQERLARFCKHIDKKGAKFLLNNSDPKNENAGDNFFEQNYSGFNIERVKARRAINCRASSRGPINELIIRNY